MTRRLKKDQPRWSTVCAFKKLVSGSGIFAKISLMRIEVLVADENPVFYDVNSPRVVVGSDIECDIILSHSEVSRQHLIIIKEGDSYFLMDKGSTNGSYINEERLIPGRRVEFNSFFPVRIGRDILISLVSDEEGVSEPIEKIEIPVPKTYQEKSNPNREDATRAISLKELKEAKTEKLVKRRTEIKKSAAADPKNSKTPKKKKKPFFKITSAYFGAISILLIAFYFNNPFEKKVVLVKPVEPKVDEEGRLISNKVAVVSSKSIEEELTKLIPDVINKFSSEKCLGNILFVCEVINANMGPPWGAVLTPSGVMIFLEFQKQILEASQVFNDPQKHSEKDIEELAVLFYLSDALKSDTDFSGLNGSKFIFSFYDTKPQPPEVRAIAVVDPLRLASLRFVFPRGRLISALGKGQKVQELTRDFYKFLYVEPTTPVP